MLTHRDIDGNYLFVGDIVYLADRDKLITGTIIETPVNRRTINIEVKLGRIKRKHPKDLLLKTKCKRT